MDFTKTGGATVTVVGLVTVFLALTLLVYVVGILAKLLGPEARSARASEATASEPVSTRPPATAEETLLLAAIAAYAAHSAHRVAVRGPQAATAWLRSGRLRQVGRSDALR